MLPFDNLSSDAEQGYLADGITEDLTTELARIPGLFVISRNAAFAYKGKETAAGRDRRASSACAICSKAAIRRAGDDMRINAQLIDATTGGHLWAERFDGAWSSLFKLAGRRRRQHRRGVKGAACRRRHQGRWRR